MNISDHGENDPLDYTLPEGWQVVAKFGREALEEQRKARNDEDAKREGRECDLFHRAAIRVAGRVYVHAMEAGNRNAAMHAWRRLVDLILHRAPEEVAEMERRMGVRG
jgi:hypothetical protein